MRGHDFRSVALRGKGQGRRGSDGLGERNRSRQFGDFGLGAVALVVADVAFVGREGEGRAAEVEDEGHSGTHGQDFEEE